MKVFLMQRMAKGIVMETHATAISTPIGGALAQLAAQTGLNGEVLASQGWREVPAITVTPEEYAALIKPPATPPQLVDVFSRPECSFVYCPHPELCRVKGCMCPKENSADPSAPVEPAPEPVEDPNRPRRSGWWQRAKASFGSN